MFLRKKQIRCANTQVECYNIRRITRENVLLESSTHKELSSQTKVLL